MTTPNDALDFYPTPDNLAWEMVHSLETCLLYTSDAADE